MMHVNDVLLKEKNTLKIGLLLMWMLLATCVSGMASPSTLDSLLNSFEKQNTLIHANRFFKQLHKEDIVDELISFPPSTPVDTLREQVWYWAAEYYYAIQQYDNATSFGKRAFPLFKKGNDRNGEADCANIIAISYIRMANYTEGAKYAKHCYALDMKSGDADRISSSLNTLAAIYIGAKQPQEAEKYVLKGIEYAKKVDNPARMSVLLGKASEVYHSMKKEKLAADYAQQGYEIEVKLGREDQKAKRLSQKAAALIGLKRYGEAVGLLEKAIPVFTKLNNQQSLGISCNQMGIALLAQEQNAEAVRYFQKAADIFVILKDSYNELHARKGLYESLWNINPQEAKAELDRFNALRDSIYNTATAESLARYNAEYGQEILMSEREAERSAKNQAICIGIIVSLFVLLIGALVWWLMRRRHLQQSLINQHLEENIDELKEKYRQLNVHYDNMLNTCGSQKDNDQLNKADRDFIERAVYITNELISSGQVDAATVADKLSMSPFQLRQRLAALTNETPQSFIQLIRMRRARHLLENHPELNITEVAHLCAYNDTPNFTRAFKKSFGITPTQYVERSTGHQ